MIRVLTTDLFQPSTPAGSTNAEPKSLMELHSTEGGEASRVPSRHEEKCPRGTQGITNTPTCGNGNGLSREVDSWKSEAQLAKPIAKSYPGGTHVNQTVRCRFPASSLETANTKTGASQTYESVLEDARHCLFLTIATSISASHPATSRIPTRNSLKRRFCKERLLERSDWVQRGAAPRASANNEKDWRWRNKKHPLGHADGNIQSPPSSLHLR